LFQRFREASFEPRPGYVSNWDEERKEERKEEAKEGEGGKEGVGYINGENGDLKKRGERE
jgi:hypothetical protein